MNRTYRSIWNESLGAWVAASEHDSARGKPNKSAVAAAVLVALAALPSFANANTFVPGTTNGTQFTVSSCTSGSGNATVGRTTTGNTNAYPVDGSGTYSTVGGCNSTGNNNLAATAYGAFAQVTGTGGTATGFLSSAGLWGTSAGLESTASGAGATALGFGATANALNSVAIGGAAGNGTTPLSQTRPSLRVPARLRSAAMQPRERSRPLRTVLQSAGSRRWRRAPRRGSQSAVARPSMARTASPKATVSPPARRARTWRSARPAPPRTAARQVAARSRSVEVGRKR